MQKFENWHEQNEQKTTTKRYHKFKKHCFFFLKMYFSHMFLFYARKKNLRTLQNHSKQAKTLAKQEGTNVCWPNLFLIDADKELSFHSQLSFSFLLKHHFVSIPTNVWHFLFCQGFNKKQSFFWQIGLQSETRCLTLIYENIAISLL